MLKINTPLVFFVMRRPQATKKVIKILERFKFKKIYVVCDGWRNEEEKHNVLIVRKIIENSFKNQKVEKIFYKKNIGLRYIAPNAFKKIFKKEKKIIVIEDDTLPDPTFFNFADQLLIKYKNNKKISMISGVNFNSKITENLRDDYFYSKYSFLWGWATWRDRWKIYDNKLKKWNQYKKSERFKKEFPNIGEYRFWKKELNYLKKNLDKGAWDFPLSFANYYYKRYSIVPKKNLVKNIGVNDDPTGINPKKTSDLKKFSISINLNHPKKLERNLKYDNYCSLNHYSLGNIKVRIKNKILKYIKKLSA